MHSKMGLSCSCTSEILIVNDAAGQYMLRGAVNQSVNLPVAQEVTQLWQ
jgi:hypothetical protein